MVDRFEQRLTMKRDKAGASLRPPAIVSNNTLTPSVLAAFSTGFSGALRIVLEIAAAFMAAFAAGGHGKIVILRKAALMIGNACAAFSGDLALLGFIHRSKAAF